MTSTTGLIRRLCNPLQAPSKTLVTPSQFKPALRVRAFTLIEVLVAMAILAVLVSLVWPSMSRYVVQIPLQQNAQDLRATFFNIRKEAMASADPVRFRIEPKSETYVIVREAKKEAAVTKLSDTFQMKETNWSTDDPVLEALPEEWLQGNSNMRDVSSIAWTPGVTFKPDGTCDHDYEVALVHKDKKMQIKIFIRGLTGAISMSGVEIEPEEEI